MEQVMNFVKPELLVLVPALYVLGAMLKNAATCKDEHIPAVLGAVGVALVALWMLSTEAATDGQQWAALAFTALVQGLLVAGLAVYANQLIKQKSKGEKMRLAEAGQKPLGVLQMAEMDTAALKQKAEKMGLRLPKDATKADYITNIVEMQKK